MKLKMYCTKCGNANEYVSQKPNFCQKCGHGFALAEEQDSPLSPDTPQQNEEQSLASTDMHGLDVEIINDGQSAPTLKDLLSAPQQNWSNKELGIKGKRGRPKKFSKDEVQKQFSKEAGALKSDKKPK